MDNIAIRYSQFDTISLRDLLMKKYDLISPVECKLYKNGLNDVYKISTGDCNFFLRVSLHSVHTLQDINEEVSVLNLLREKGLHIVEPKKCSNGEFVWEINAPEGIRQAVLFLEIKNSPSGSETSKKFNLGAAIAKIHEAADNANVSISRPPIGIETLSERPLELIKPYLINRKDDYDFMLRTNQILYRYATENLPCEAPYYGFCHGDIQSTNYFYDGEQPIIFDFDCLGYGWRAYDLGVYLANETFADNDIYKKPAWVEFLKGYNSIRELTQNEVKAIFVFSALHIMRVMAFHADIVERNNGVMFFMSNQYFNLFISAYRRLTEVARNECGILL